MLLPQFLVPNNSREQKFSDISGCGRCRVLSVNGANAGFYKSGYDDFR